MLARPRALALKLLLLALLGASALAQDLLATVEGRQVVFEALVEVFKEHYWNEDHLDWASWADSFREDALAARSRPEFDAVARRMVAAVADGHSSWWGFVHHVEDRVDDKVGDEAELPLQPSRPGLGFSHRHLDGVGIVVLRVFPDTPAEAVGLRRGDVIVRVGGEDVRDIIGATSPGSVLGEAIKSGKVMLVLRRKAEVVALTLTPAPLQLGVVSEMPIAEMLDASIGYLYLPSFNHEGIAERVHELLAGLEAEGARALVLDMRGNLGGRLSEMGLVLGAFIDGPWGRAVSRNSVAWEGHYSAEDGLGRSWLETPDGRRFSGLALETRPVRFVGPLVVLVDAHNNSAGEVAPLALQALGRAKVVGEPTGGNVEAIRGFDLPDGSLVFVAVANIQAPTGESFDDGLVPDVYASEDLADLARGFDAPVAEALRLLRELPFTPGRFF
jgi:carboxyl-terminal processing protease